MKFNEEYIAENLYGNLKKYFSEKGKSIGLTKEGAGVHWNCNIELKDRKCIIHCFEHRHYENVKPEYLISFEESGTNLAWGRTHDIGETIQSSEDWINNQKVNDLYQKFEFVDWYKRRIQTIESQLLNHEPKLEQTERMLTSSWGSGLCNYYISYKDRSCELSGYGKEVPISFKLKWDNCNLFEVRQDDLPLLAEVIRKWLVDEIKPSKLDNEYDWIDVGELAEYYERGEGVIGEFIESWNSIERFYNQLSDERQPFKIGALKLIREMRKEGLDKEIRAGQSLFFFVLSRARRHGLETDQSYLSITFLGKNKMKVESNLDIENNEVEYDVQYDGYVKEVIRKLLREKIE